MNDTPMNAPMSLPGAEERVEDYAPVTGKSTACTKCGLEAKTMLHPFCTHRICPVRTLFGNPPPTGMLGLPL